MSEKHDDFYEMIKEWTIRDFRTPDIKGEVIVNMLISDFIEELLQCHYKDYYKNNNVKLLMKEFPMELVQEPENGQGAKMNSLDSCAKVDYLVSVGSETLVLVELKTSNESFNSKQKNRMNGAATNPEPQKLLDFYRKIHGRYKDSAKKNRQYGKKYQYRHKQYENAMPQGNIDNFTDVDFLYIFLEANNRSLQSEALRNKDLNNKNLQNMDLQRQKLILKEYCRDGKKYEDLNKILEAQGEGRSKLWEKISDILLECAKELGNNGEVLE